MTPAATPPVDTTATPALSVVVVTPTTFTQVRRTVDHLRRQSIAGRLELVLVVPTPDATDDADPAELAPFAAVQVVPVGPIPNVDRASADGIHAARAPIVAIVEDHAFVQPGWAEGLLRAYDAGDWTAVGAVMSNANPRTHLSWCNLLLAYGWWLHPERAGQHEDVPGHNISYRRDALTAFGEDLRDRLGRAGDLHDRLRDAGARMLLAPDAGVAHVNPSRWRSTSQLRFNAGRLYGWQRSRDWSAGRRLLYALGSPLIPLVRLLRLRGDQLAGSATGHLQPGILPTLLAVLVLDALGQAAGYLAGPGGSIDVLATFEMDRRQHLARVDEPLLAPIGPAEVLRSPVRDAA
jgi:hypothetical protein